jgi:hypothetical protein
MFSKQVSKTLKVVQKRMATNKVTLVMGGQWGDEGKGKLFDP